jgi:transcription elongation factor Elf1
MSISKRLNHDEQNRALVIIAQWRRSAGTQQCPRCDAAQLTVEDQSARPHAEWYHLACSSCGLDAMLQIPLAAPPLSLD